MFPSSGFFKGIICPYLASGLCERPYCHYRHTGLRPEDKKPMGLQAGSDSAVSNTGQQLMTYESSIPVRVIDVSTSEAIQAPSRHMPSMLNMVGSALSRVQTRGVNDKAVLYRPTPKSATKSVTSTVTNSANRLKSGIPEYTPTPIHLLKQSKSKVDDLEYDPISNYSTNMQSLCSVRVTLADAERDTLKRPLGKADTEASVAKRPKIDEGEARFSEEEDESAEKKKTTKTKLGNGKMPPSSSLENSSTFKAEDDANNIQSDLTLSSDALKNVNIKAEINSVKDGKEEQKATKETSPNHETSTEEKVDDAQKVTKEISPNCETSSEKKEDEDSRGGVSYPSIRNSDSNDKGAKKKDKMKDKRDVESSKHQSDSRDGESGNKRDHDSNDKNAEKLGTVNKENKRRSTSKDDERSSANQHRHRHHHHHNNHRDHDRLHHSSKDHGKSVSKEQNEHLKEPKQLGKEHSKHSEGQKKLSNKEHRNSKEHQENLQQTVKQKERSDLSKDLQRGKSCNEEKSVQNKSHSSSIHKKSEKDRKSDSKNRLASEPCAQNQEKDAKKNDGSLTELNRKNLMRSMSEYTKLAETPAEKGTRRGSLEETVKTHHTDPRVSARDAFESSSLRSEKSSYFPKSNATNRLPSSSVRGQHRTLSNSSSSSNKSKSTSLGTSKATKRTISQVELFGEDSDTELDLNEKQSVLTLGSGDDRFHQEKRSRTSRDMEDDESDASSDVIDELLDESENPSSSRFEECHRLFLEARGNEGSSVATQPTTTKEVKVAQNVKDPPPPGKKRVAHTPINDMDIKRILPEPKRIKPNAANAMLNRYLELQKAAAAAAAASDKAPLSKDQEVPNSVASAMASGCMGTPSTASLKIKPRVAHLPKSGDFLKKPILTIIGSSKIPVNVRQSCLDKIFHECCNIYDEAQDAKDRALAEEKAMYEKSATKSIYLNLISNAVRRLRDESPISKTLSPKNPNARSHEAILGGLKAASTSFTVNRWGKPPPVPDTFSGAELYKRLHVYLMSETQLVENSYPQPNPNNRDEVVIQKSERDLQKPQSSDPNQKFCCRCGKAFVILPNFTFAREEECLYHWGHAWKQRVGGTFDNIYNCCGGDLSSRGCQMSKCHVHDDNKYRCLTGYMTTMPSSPRRDGDYGVYALDCEMVYTTFGCELARITVIGPNLELVLDKIVKPDHEVIDYNTRFSGLTADDLRNVTTSIRDVQAILLHLFNSKTILIGHSLESDLVALKLVHNTVVDTSIVFPHRRGLPFKRALQNVVKETLQKIIQNNISGHDSSEDARSCMELMLWKVKEDAKRSLRFA